MKETTLKINDLKNANSHISSMALTAKWAETFKKYALDPNETLSDDPGSSFNVFLHLTAFGAAKSIYEQEARINEANESTAILPKSLLNKISIDELSGLFGTPSSTTIAFCIKESDIIEHSVPKDENNVSETTSRMILINRDMEITFESHPTFRLPYDVQVNCKPIISVVTNPDTGQEIRKIDHNIYATYDMPISANAGMKSIYNIHNNNISSRKMRYEGNTYIAFFLKIYQISRKTIQFYVNDPFTSDTTVSFENNLVGFEVYRKKAGTSKWILMGPGLPEGTMISTPNGFNYSYDNKRNSQNFNVSFSKLTGSTALDSGDEIKITVYSTQGERGNINFPYMIYNLNKLIINYNQDLTDTAQNKLLNIVALAFARDDKSFGGRNQLSHEEIRAKVIAKKYSRNILITDNEIKNKAMELGLDAYKAQSDIISLYYRGVDKLTHDNMILSTGTNDFDFDLKSIPQFDSAANVYLIKPTDTFLWDKSNKRFKFLADKEEYTDYITKYNNTSDIETVMQASFPFYVQYKNTENPSVNVYDMNLNLNEYASFVKYSEKHSLDKLDISFVKIQRNPYKKGILTTPASDPANTYYITFIVYTGENTLNKLYSQKDTYLNSASLEFYEKQYIKFHVKLTGAGNKNEYLINPSKVVVINPETMINDGYVAYQATIVTDNYITPNKKIRLKNIRNTASISSDFSTYMLVDTSVKITIEGAFADANLENSYSNFSSVYEVDDIKLVDYISSFGIDFDIKTELTSYETWLEDKPMRYSETVYQLNPNYDPAITEATDVNHYRYMIERDNTGTPIFIRPSGTDPIITPKYKVLHSVGDIMYYYESLDDENIKIDEIDITNEDLTEYVKKVKLSHKKGDYIYHTKELNGNMVPVDEPTAIAMNNTTYSLKPKPTSYTGILKNVPWIDRMYFADEDTYEIIRKLYLNLIDRIDQIKNILFDGGQIYASLKRTSGNSLKYKAYLLNSDSTEGLKNIALSIVYRVKFQDNLTIESKKQLIIDSTVEYINNLGNSSLSIDNLFEFVKRACPNIEYINITKINNYKNGEVQTILNDTSITNEVLTVSQKITTDENGNITFKPDITVDVINNN